MFILPVDLCTNYFSPEWLQIDQKFVQNNENQQSLQLIKIIHKFQVSKILLGKQKFVTLNSSPCPMFLENDELHK